MVKDLTLLVAGLVAVLGLTAMASGRAKCGSMTGTLQTLAALSLGYCVGVLTGFSGTELLYHHDTFYALEAFAHAWVVAFFSCWLLLILFLWRAYVRSRSLDPENPTLRTPTQVSIAFCVPLVVVMVIGVATTVTSDRRGFGERHGNGVYFFPKEQDQ